jgi:hypothetical protein
LGESHPLDAVGYRLFTPPFDLRFREWSRGEARAYFEWFTAHIQERIDELQRVVGRIRPDLPHLDRSPDSLFLVGAFFVDNIRVRPKTQEEIAELRSAITPRLREIVPISDWIMDDATLSLCADVGIYFGEVLRDHHRAVVRWSLWTRRTAQYQRPVLVGFAGSVPLDPVRIAVNVAYDAGGGRSNPNRLRELFGVWSNKVLP